MNLIVFQARAAFQNGRVDKELINGIISLGVSYDAGFPHQSSDENAQLQQKVSSKSGISNASRSSANLQSFTIFEDSNSSSSHTSSTSQSSSSSIASSWQGALRSSSSSVSCSAAAPSKTDVKTSSTLQQQETSVTQGVGGARPRLKEIKISHLSPTKNRLKSKIQHEKYIIESKTTRLGPESPEDMEISICDNSMMVDTPSLVTSLPKEESLERREKDFWDVSEYAQDIYSYLRNAEVCHKPRVNYMQKQTDITASMRWILVDWLVEVAEEYSLHTETLYLAVSYIDRFLSQMSVKRDKLQLVGTTAMFIASKYEEIYPPDVSQFSYITDNTYKVSQILRMEHLILKVLSFDIAVPTALVFVDYFGKLCKCREETLHLAMFLSELSMLDSDPFLRYLPSKIAAAAMALANWTQGKEAWSAKLCTESGYSLDDLRECYVNLHRSFCKINDQEQHAIRDKYKSSKWHSVSLLSPREKFPW
ncbi:G2/mitotic-specific cyclin-A [Armadillidium nasatum]|uniref:G2/mitotic-specific cyclin-A n=1 Tax=Armadillidium nasatum TaxID=96803 RepID=A0A5N5SQA7_9CRUS|nr:G2/mitotic-specific cyclin-A [Armadillidium nasatum]